MTASRRRSKSVSLHRGKVLPACMGSLLLLLGCGGGGGGPTAPSLDVPASIGGQVVDSSASASQAPVTGVTVRIVGTSAATTTDGEGRFSLAGVPMGDQILSFEQAGEKADLAIDSIQPAEDIQMVVSLLGSTVQVQSMDRGSGANNGVATVTLEKATNGEDADRPPGPSIPIGAPVEWTYVVTNTGDVELSRVEVSDDRGVLVSCPGTVLGPKLSMTCSGAGTALAGQYANLGTVTALDPDLNPLGAEDPSHYFGTASAASIDIEKSTNGEDADKAPGPTIPAGETVTWEYFVLNDGGLELFDIVVTDNQGVAVDCPRADLAPEESMICTGVGIAVEGQYANLGTVTADDGSGKEVGDEDMSHYFGEAAGGGAFTIDVQSDHWNTNWPGSSGTVSVKIQDGDLAAVDTTSIILFEADPFVFAEPTSQPRITGNHLRAQFSKSDAFAVLDNPQTGETRVVTVRFVADGLTIDLQAEIEIVGPAI